MMLSNPDPIVSDEFGMVHSGATSGLAGSTLACPPGAFAGSADGRLFILALMPAGAGPKLAVQPRDANGNPVGTPTWLTPVAPWDPLPGGRWLWLEGNLPACAGLYFPPQASEGWLVAVDTISRQPVLRPDFSVQNRRSACLVSDGDPGICGPVREEFAALPPPDVSAFQGTTWERAWNLAGWVSGAWEYRNSLSGVTYAPWHAPTILEWGRRCTAPDGKPVIAMCVHYAVVFQQIATAWGMSVRLVVLTSGLNQFSGHFICEIWLPERGRWALIDPNHQLCFRGEDGHPLSVAEVAVLPDPAPAAHHGANPPPPASAFCLTPELYRYIGYWAHHDFVANPVHAAPGHGMMPYAETAILWLESPDHPAPPQFPHVLDPASLGKPGS